MCVTQGHGKTWAVFRVSQLYYSVVNKRDFSFSVSNFVHLAFVSKKVKGGQVHSQSMCLIMTPMLLTFQSIKIAKQEGKVLPVNMNFT